MTGQFWKRAAAALLAGAGVTLTGAAAEKELILRQAGKPDRTCAIEDAEPMADGAVKLRLRDTATGHISSF